MIILIWIISLLVLIACIVIVYRMVVTSNEFISTDKASLFKFLNSGGRDKLQRQKLSVLQSRIKSLEDSNTFYEIQFSKFKSQINNSESGFSQTISDTKSEQIAEEEEEDWKELYYQENESKVQLENDLDEALQSIERAKDEISKLKEESVKVAPLKSKLDARLIELKSLQNEVENLQQKLLGAVSREKDLQMLLEKEIASKTIYDKIEKENVRLRSEVEEQRRQITEMHHKEMESMRQLARGKELQSRLDMFEEEKMRKMMELNHKMEKNKIFFQ